MVEVSLTVGKLDASLALLLTKDHHLIEFPTILLPNGVKAGSIVKIKCERDLETEVEEQRQFQATQDEILNTFGKNLPQAPLLKVKNVTQTSCVLEWDQLELGTALLKNLVLYKDGKKLGAIPQPLTNRTTKLSGLPIDKVFKFQLRLDTTAGVYLSEVIEVATHKMTDLSGITVCLGDITANEQFTVEDIHEALKNMGAHFPAQDKVKVDTTHFITTRENKQNPEYLKANDMNIPIIRPEWLKACERERRIVGVRDFYVKDCVLPDIIGKNYWKVAAPEPPAKDEITPESEEKATSLAVAPPSVHVTSPSPEVVPATAEPEVLHEPVVLDAELPEQPMETVEEPEATPEIIVQEVEEETDLAEPVEETPVEQEQEVAVPEVETEETKEEVEAAVPEVETKEIKEEVEPEVQAPAEAEVAPVAETVDATEIQAASTEALDDVDLTDAKEESVEAEAVEAEAEGSTENVAEAEAPKTLLGSKKGKKKNKKKK